LPVALQFYVNFTSLHMFPLPRRNGIYYKTEQINDSKEITFPVALPYNVNKITFFYCNEPSENNRTVNFIIGKYGLGIFGQNIYFKLY